VAAEGTEQASAEIQAHRLRNRATLRGIFACVYSLISGLAGQKAVEALQDQPTPGAYGAGAIALAALALAVYRTVGAIKDGHQASLLEEQAGLARVMPPRT